MLLQLVEQCDDFLAAVNIVGTALRRRRHGKRADVILTNVGTKLEVAGTPSVQQFHPHTDHEELPDLLFKGQVLQSFFCPAVIGSLNVMRECWLGLFPRFRNRPQKREHCENKNEIARCRQGTSVQLDSKGQVITSETISNPRGMPEVTLVNSQSCQDAKAMLPPGI